MKNILLLLVIPLFHMSFVSAQAEIAEIARLGRGTATTLSWRPDGEILAVGGSAGIWLFDANYQQIAHYADFPASKIEFSPNGDYLAVSDVNDMTEFWRLGSRGELLQQSKALPLDGYGLRWSPDSKRVSNYESTLENGEFKDTEIKVWDVALGKRIWTTTIPGYTVDVVWSPDGRYVAGVNWDGYIVVMDSATSETTQVIQLPEDPYSPTGIAFQDNGDGFWLIFFGSDRLWKWEENNLHETNVVMPSIYTGLQGLEKQPDGDFLITENIGGGGAQGGLYVLSEQTSPLQIVFHDYIADYAWMPGTSRLTILTGNGMIRERNVLNDNSAEYQLYASQNVIAWSPDSRWILQTTGSNPDDFSYPVMLWDIAHATVRTYQPDKLMYPFLSAKWSRWLPDSQHIMVFSDVTTLTALCLTYHVEQWDIFKDDVTYYWEGGLCGLQNMSDTSDLNWDYVGDWTEDFSLAAVASRNEIPISADIPYNDPTTKFETEGRVTSVKWSPHAKYLLAISKDQDADQTFVEVWNYSTQERVVQFPLTEPLIWAEWSPNEEALALLTGSQDSSILSVVDVPTGDKRFEMSFNDLPTIRWKPDGAQLAVMQTPIEGEKIDVVDSQTGDSFPLVTVNDVITVTGMDWHPSGDWLAVSTGNELRIYDVRGRSIVMSALSESHIIDWSPDGTMLATRYPDETIGVWRVNLGEM